MSLTGIASQKASPAPSELERRVDRAKRDAVDRIISDGKFELDIRSGRWYTADGEYKPLRLKAVGRELGTLFWGLPESLAKMRGITYTFEPRAQLRQECRGKDVHGYANPDPGWFKVANDLSLEKEREVIAHEVAHCLFSIACDGSDMGEECASAFAAGFCSVPWGSQS